MKDYKAEYENKKITVEEALSKIESDMNIYVGVDAAEPAVILREMYTICDKVKNVTINSVLGPEDYMHFHDESGNIRTEPFFTDRTREGRTVREMCHLFRRVSAHFTVTVQRSESRIYL